VAVLFDIQGVQSPAHAERGVARYLLELAQALERWYPDRVARYLLNRDLAVPGTLEPLEAAGRLAFNDRLRNLDGTVYHAGSPFEDVPLERLWPQAAYDARTPLVVTLYDLIPKLFPDVYLSDPVAKSQYNARLDLLRRADRVLAISEATARDALRELALRPERVVVVGAAVSEGFKRPESRAAIALRLRAELPWVESGLILYVGGIEPRKNILRLLEAYARLPERLRAAHPLAVVCRVLPSERAELERRLRKLGIRGRVHFPGYVPDEQLVMLYQAAELFVFPSLYEGFGLPVAEAIACGAPAIASRSSSLVELVYDDEALFDPLETASIAAALTRALEDEHLRARLRDRTLDSRHTWRGVAGRVADTYDDLLSAERKPLRRIRRRIAVVTPLPPQRSGVADYSYRLLEAMREHCALDAFVDELPDRVRAPDDVGVYPIRWLQPAERMRGRYDGVVYCLGNSEYHAEALALLRERPGVVLAHDVRLTGLYSWSAAHRPDLEPRGFAGALSSMYEYRVPPDVGPSGWLSYEKADRYGVYMAQEAISSASRYLVHSRYAKQIAQLDALPGDAEKVEILDFAFPDPDEFPHEEPPAPIVATFGLVAPVKQTAKVVEAFALVAARHQTATLAVVGPAGAEGALEASLELAHELGVGDRVHVTGELSDGEFRAWVGRTTVAVQLRQTSNGESAASVADCLAAGVPTVVTGIGSSRELPDDCVVKVERDVDKVELASMILALLDDDGRRKAMAQAAQRYAREHSFAKTAERLYRLLVPSGRPAEDGDVVEPEPREATAELPGEISRERLIEQRLMLAEIVEELEDERLTRAAAAELIWLRSRCEELEAELASARLEALDERHRRAG
jgi:glycosyltransferase involved in cell wall biosynthesis